MKLSPLLRRLGFTIVAVVVLYPLSIGPVTILYNRIPSERLRAVIELCYDPLDSLCTGTPLDPIIEGYVDWWSRLAPEVEIPDPTVTSAPPPSQP